VDEAVRGELMVVDDGLEGGAVYALGRQVRAALDAQGEAELRVDLRPDLDPDATRRRLHRIRAGDSTSKVLGRALGLAPVAIGLLREATGNELPRDPAALAELVHDVPLRVHGLQGLDRAISTAGGVVWDELDERLMLRRRPGVFLAGEMLDWDAPTGGYLLQATFATARAAARGALEWLPDR
jgi:predicted flavoprotein YhiN